MADNSTLPATGDIVRTLEDGSAVKWQAVVQAYATTVGTPDVLTVPTAAALADNTATPTTVLYGVCNLVYDGATWDMARGDATNGTLVYVSAQQVDDAAFTPATSKILMAGFQADETATDSVDEGDGGAARMTLDRKQIVADYAHTTGGCSNYSALSTAAVLTAEVKGSAGQVYELQCFNHGAAAVHIRLYNQTGAPAAGDTANIVWRGTIPGNTAGAGFVVSFDKGRAFSTGIGVRVSAAVADNDTTVLTANEVKVSIGYK